MKVKKTMSKYYFLAIVIFFFLFTSFNVQNEEDLINWNGNYKLKWEDFKGEIDINNTHGAMSAVGFQMSNFKWSKNSGNGVIVAIFDTKDSWTRTNSNELGLKHEQGHFDITEIYARLLRKKLNNKRFKKNKISKEIVVIFDQFEKEKNDYQDLYDNETDHSKNTEKQAEWYLKIEKQLKELEKYSDTEIVIKF